MVLGLHGCKAVADKGPTSFSLQQCALCGLQVSHDLKEVAPLVDNAWSMKLGGTLEPVQWPQSPDQ